MPTRRARPGPPLRRRHPAPGGRRVHIGEDRLVVAEVVTTSTRDRHLAYRFTACPNDAGGHRHRNAIDDWVAAGAR